MQPYVSVIFLNLLCIVALDFSIYYQYNCFHRLKIASDISFVRSCGHLKVLDRWRRGNRMRQSWEVSSIALQPQILCHLRIIYLFIFTTSSFHASCCLG